jgi:predicted DCC family thiol-disulfide oxidoreductase YuxK
MRAAVDMPDPAANPATLLYDGDCGLCMATAAWLGRRVAARRLRLLALSDAAREPILGEIVAGRDLSATLHVVLPNGRVLTGARAVLATGRLVPRWRTFAVLFDHRLGHVILEPIYRQVARHRRAIGRLLRLPDTCPIPTVGERPR